MSTPSATLYNPLNGGAEATWEGFSWPAFFFGIFWLLVKGLYGQAIICFLLALCTFGFAVPVILIAYGVMGNDMHSKSLIKKGYLRRDQLDINDPRFKHNEAANFEARNLGAVQEEIEHRFTNSIYWDHLDQLRHMLTEKQVNANSDSQRGVGWLQMATNRSRKDACEILLEFGADPKRTDKQGQTALGIAEAKDNQELSAIFLKIEGKHPPRQVDAAASKLDLPGQIRQLADLKTAGFLGEEEFLAAKAKLLQ